MQRKQSCFILMLTKNDRTVENVIDAYEAIRSQHVSHIGVKDDGISDDQLRRLARQVHDDGAEVVLELVSTQKEQVLASVRLAVELGIEYLLSAVHFAEILPLICNTPIRYFPFCDNPSSYRMTLEGSFEDAICDALQLSEHPSVHGLALTPYRTPCDAPRLIRAIVDATDKPVVVAGSIDSISRIEQVAGNGSWGFTIGSAIFNHSFGAGEIHAQIEAIMELPCVCTPVRLQEPACLVA